MNQLSSRDLEQISAYLDGQLSQADSARLESRIQSDPQLRSVYEGLRQSRAVLRQLPARRAPRNFRLTPKMAGIKPPLPRAFPVFRLASALAAILFFLGYTVNLTAPLAASMGAAATFAYGANVAPAVEMAAPAATEAPQQTFAPKIVPSEAAGLAPQDTAAATATSAEATTLAVSATEPTESIEIAPQPNPSADLYSQRVAIPQPPALPVHPIWLFGFLGLAVVSGAGAFVVRFRTEQKWNKANAAGPVRLKGRDLFLLTLAAIVVLLLSATVYWMSTGFSAPVTATLGANKVNVGDMLAQQIPYTPEIGYSFTAVDSQGLVNSITIPTGALEAGTALYYIPVLETVAPEHVAYFAEHAFSVLPSPKSVQLHVSAPMTIWVDYNETASSIPDENKLALYWWSGSQWLDAAATCTPVSTYERFPDNNQVGTSVCQFGTFLLVAP